MAARSLPVRARIASQADVAMSERHTLPCGLPDDAGKISRRDRADFRTDFRTSRRCHVALLPLPGCSSRARKNACRPPIRLLDSHMCPAHTGSLAYHTGDGATPYPARYGDAAACPAVCRDRHHYHHTSPDLNPIPIRLQAPLTAMRRSRSTPLLILPLDCLALCQPSLWGYVTR